MKKKRLILMAVMLMTATAGFAAGINFVESQTWKEVLARAKREHKMIFLDAYATWCGPCKYMQNTVFTTSNVGEYFNANFINAKIDMEKGEGPELSKQFGVTAYPTLLFFNADGKMMHKYVGAIDGGALIDLGRDAQDPDKQYYPRKERAVAGNMNLQAFRTWVQEAAKFEDQDLNTIIAAYVNRHSDQLMDKDMLDLIFSHSVNLTDTQLASLQNNAAAIIKESGYTRADYDKLFKAKVIEYALDKALKNTTIDFVVFNTAIKKYLPGDAVLETQKMRVKYYFFKDEPVIALKELALLFERAAVLKLDAKSMANLIMDYGEKIAANNQVADFEARTKRFQLTKADAIHEYYKDVALLALHHYNKDTVKKNLYARKLLANNNTPDELRALAKNVVDAAN